MKKYWQYSTAESFKNCYSLRHIKLREKCWSDESHTGDWLAHLAGGPTLTFALKPKASDNSTTLCHRLIYFQTSGDNPSIFNCQFLKGQWLWATFAQVLWGMRGNLDACDGEQCGWTMFLFGCFSMLEFAAPVGVLWSFRPWNSSNLT